MSECEEVEQWVELGATLRMTQSDLDSIEHSHGEDPARCKRELFKVQWPCAVKTLNKGHLGYIECVLNSYSEKV